MPAFDRDLWFVLQVMSRHEKAIDTLLEYKGYDHFLPTCWVRRRWSDRVKVIQEPLFPGYVFCRSQRSLMEVVRNTPGIIRIVNCGGKPQAVPDEDVDALRRVVNSKRDICALPYFHAGQKVEVITGPLSGITGIITQIKKRDRLVLAVDVIMKSVSIEIGRAEVVALPTDLLLHPDIEPGPRAEAPRGRPTYHPAVKWHS